MYKITVYAICKNEEKFIYRWFNSIKNADYIRVLDTGSTDSTITLLQELKENYPNKFDYSCQEINPWRFDVARNTAMQLIPDDTDVFVSADLDDVFISNWREIVEKNIEKGYNKIFGRYPYYNSAGEIVSETLQDRISLKGSYWEGAIHERLIMPNENSIIDNEWIIEHRQDEHKDRRENYLTAAKNGAQDGDSYARLCLGYELYNSGFIQESFDTFKELYNDLSYDSEYLTRKMVVFIGQLCRELGNPNSAVSYYEEAKKIFKEGSPFEDYFLYEENYINNLIKEIYPTKVCVYTICKNEEQFVEEWFNRVKGADLVVVLDTGSTDNTCNLFTQLVKQNNNLIFYEKTYEYFSFCNARNDVLNIVKNTLNDLNGWVALHIDMDEMIDYHTVEHVKQQWNSSYDLVELTAYNVNNMISIKGHRLCQDISWYYDIHEKTAYADFRRTNNLLIQNCGYNHYQDTTKERNYYTQLQNALQLCPNCIHYLTYAIWEAQLHYDYNNLQSYCKRNLYNILNNEKDEHYKDWAYYVYTCLVYLDTIEPTKDFLETTLTTLDAQEEYFKGYYIFKASLCERLNIPTKRKENLLKALSTPRINSWIEDNFNITDDEINTILKEEFMDKVTVYAICKNEEKEVNAWMESMIEADYVCVLDTGSTDQTYHLLKEWANQYPEKVIVDQKVISPWRFDTARNESMALIPSDTNICVCTDLDERLISGWSDDVRELWTNNTTRMTYKYAWSHNSDGSPARVFWYDKIHSYGEWAWKFQVHESLYYFGQRPEQTIALKDEKIYLHHYPDITKTHRSNYLPLLEARAREYPDDWYGLVYLAHEYHYQNKDQECINFILSTVMPKLQWHNDDMLCATDLYLFLGKASQRMENYDNAEIFYTLGIKSAPTYRENYLHLAEMFFNLGHYEKCIETINTCLIKTQRYYSWLEEDDSWSFKPYDLLSLAYYYIGQKEVSLQFAKIALSYNTSNERLQNNVKVIEENL